MKLITLTLNPAFDVHCHIADFEPFHENLATVTDREAGGKGVNISRALTMNGVENLALVVLGEENGDSFRRALDADRMQYREIPVPGRIRENITIHTDHAPETRISFSGFETDAALLATVEKELEEVMEDGSIVTFTGRVPDGISMDDVKAFLRRLIAKGARIVIDSRSFTKEDLLEIRPWLIKPNQEEISVYLNRPINTFEEVLDGAASLHEQGIENVMISMGEQGALLVCSEGRLIATPPAIQAVSTIGAGDSSIGGFLAAAAEGASSVELLKRAVSYGTAACMSAGTRPPSSEDVASIFQKVTVRTLS